LVLAGSGPEREALERSVLEAGLSDCVEFVGQVTASGVRDVLRGAHAFVLPSEFEGLPVSLIEALATGLPVIATDGAPPELFPSYAGSRLPFGDSVALAHAMEQVMNQYADFDRSHIREFAVERYDFRRVADRLIEIYRQCGDRPPEDRSAHEGRL
jgi:L-malate glycosyltransferase